MPTSNLPGYREEVSPNRAGTAGGAHPCPAPPAWASVRTISPSIARIEASSREIYMPVPRPPHVRFVDGSPDESFALPPDREPR